MNRRTLTARIIIMAAFILAASLGISTATQAQCCTATITNNTNCPITICIRTVNGSQCAVYPANSVQVVNVPCIAFQVWVESCGIPVQVLPGMCVDPVHLAGGCCAKVCFGKDAAGCYTITAGPSAFACPCD
jgi:hypothetical protein